MEDGVTFETLNEETPSGSTLQAEDTQLLRNELITLAEKHEIKHSVAYIRKASHSALEKIKGEYERKQLEETNEFLTETLMGKLSEFMEEVNMIDDAKSMEEELTHNKMVKRDLKNILGYVTPYIPLIGLVCAVSIVGKHMYNRKQTPTTQAE
jgi:predicted house-cleaning noncanonical NTP pyrophosphatase (MazG superfamily)